MIKATILDRQGNLQEVTDLDAALKQAENANHFHTHHKGLQFPDAKKDWEHILLELQKIKKRL